MKLFFLNKITNKKNLLVLDSGLHGRNFFDILKKQYENNFVLYDFEDFSKKDFVYDLLESCPFLTNSLSSEIIDFFAEKMGY